MTTTMTLSLPKHQAAAIAQHLASTEPRALNGGPEEGPKPKPKRYRSDRETTAYDVDSVMQGRISGMHDYGYFVRLPNGESGLMLKQQACWPGESITLSLGQEVKVRVKDFKPGRGLALSMRMATPHELFDQFVATHACGCVLRGQIKNVLDYGVFVIVAPGVTGLLHVSAIPNIHIYSRASVGQTIEVKITQIDAIQRRLQLELA